MFSSAAVVFTFVACAIAAPLDPVLEKRLQAVDAKAAAIKDLTAHFEQRKFSPLLKNPITSTGTIRALGDAMLWLTDKPEPTQLRIDAKSLQLLYVNQKSLEVYPLKGKMASLATSPLPRLATLKEKFDIEPRAEKATSRDSVALTLRPRDDDMKRYVDHIDVNLNMNTGVLDYFELTDPDGERTQITFTDAKLNTGLSPKDLDLTPPPGTKTVHPLDTQAP